MTTRPELGQTLNLQIDHIPAGRPNRPASPLHAQFITVHNTDNRGATADAEAHSRFLKETGYYIHKGSKRWVSWHYTVDSDSCVRHLPLNEVGWHAGSSAGNSGSIGIEICMNDTAKQADAFARAQRLIACLCYDLHLDPRTAVRAHHHWSGKLCPSLLIENEKLGTKWDAFIDDIQSHLDAIQDPIGV